jgi:hypothetical protein
MKQDPNLTSEQLEQREARKEMLLRQAETIKQRRTKALFEKITKDWTPADWKETSIDDLNYHISEWIDQGGDTSDLDLAVHYFERYMGW